MTSNLAQEQMHLLEAISGRGSSSFNPRGLQVYQANRAVLAERTLASTYPVVAQLIGVESFEPLARHFWQQHPPQRGDMGQWGAQLPEFLEALQQLADEPFLPDVARVEWALHRAASAPDAVLDAPSFALLAAGDAQPVSLALSPGVATLASAYPVVSIINAHLAGQPTLDEAAALLRQGHGEHALVWRQGFKPKLRALSRAEYQLITALAKREALEAALDQASGTDGTFDFNTWLGQAVQTGLITGAIDLSI
jgi:hypothetical protein